MSAPPELNPAQRRAWHWSLALTLLRLVLAPVMLYCAWQPLASWVLVGLLTTALVSDILDGRVLARAGVNAPGLRALDSAVDTVFYVAAALAAWHRRPVEIEHYLVPILAVLALEVLNNAFGLLKYGRTPGYHARSARLFGVLLFLSLALLLGGAPWTLLPLTLALGALAQIESLTITMLLPVWTHDVPSVWRAISLRRW